MIPKVIHYCWFGGTDLPKTVKHCIRSWRNVCPDYEIKRWDESNFDINSHPFVKAAYEAKCWAFVSDYARLKIIYDNGGVYLDTDVELLKSLDSVLNCESYFAVQQTGRYIATGLGFGAMKGSDVVFKMLCVYDLISFDTSALESFACPLLNTKVLDEFYYDKKSDNVQDLGNGIIVYPPKYFDPYSTIDAVSLMCSDTISIHHYDASWTSNSQKLKRKIVRLIGIEKFVKLRKFFNRNL